MAPSSCPQQPRRDGAHRASGRPPDAPVEAAHQLRHAGAQVACGGREHESSANVVVEVDAEMVGRIGGELIRELMKLVGGSGGGKPPSRAGRLDGVPALLDAVPSLVKHLRRTSSCGPAG